MGYSSYDELPKVTFVLNCGLLKLAAPLLLCVHMHTHIHIQSYPVLRFSHSKHCQYRGKVQ